MINIKEEEKKTTTEDAELEEIIKAGLHFGHKTNKKHPKMEPYIFGVRNGVSVIDASKTKEKLNEALDFLTDAVSNGKTILLVGTKVQLRDLVKATAEECSFSYVDQRWLGGTVTNFEFIKKRVDHLKDLEKKKEEGELEKYTKKERTKIDKEIEALKVKFQGLKSLSKIPDIMFIIDMVHDSIAVKEARAKGVKIIAIADTDADPTLVDYPIPANDDALTSIRYILNKVKEAVLKAKETEAKES